MTRAAVTATTLTAATLTAWTLRRIWAAIDHAGVPG
jgi:hypothetical protein